MNPTLPDLRGFRPMCRYQARIGFDKNFDATRSPQYADAAGLAK